MIKKTFLLVLAIFLPIYVILIAQNRIPIAHDTFQYLHLQYVYFNEIAENHSLILWFPFLAQGLPGSVYFGPVQLSVLSPVYYLIGLATKNINYLYLFYFLLFFEELIFLLGIFLLGSIYYRNLKTILFVSVTLIGTSIWYPQVWWNFHLYYFIPLLFYCLHRSLATCSFRYLIFALIIFNLAIYGNVYSVIFDSFAVFIYLAGLIGLEPAKAKRLFLKSVGIRNIILLMVLLVTIFIGLSYQKGVLKEISYNLDTRDASGKITLNNFLTWGGSAGIGKYSEMFNRVRWLRTLDINLYAGFFLIPFILIALLYVRRKHAFLVGGVSLVVFLFGIGSLISILFYYLWPFGQIFRHIGLTAPLCKMFMVFYAGFGFEKFIEEKVTDRRIDFLIAGYLLFILGSLVLIAIVCFYVGKPPLISIEHFWFISRIELNILSWLPYLILASGIILFWGVGKNIIKREQFIRLLFILLVIDMFSYKYALLVDRMPIATKAVIALFRPYRYGFPMTRAVSSDAYLKNGERMQVFDNIHSFLSNRPERGMNRYSTSTAWVPYNTVEAFFFTDSAASIFKTDFLTNSIKEYKTIQGRFPNQNSAYLKMSGIGYPKISLFSTLNEVEDASIMGRIFARKDFYGDMIFAATKDIREKAVPPDATRTVSAEYFANQDQRVEGTIEVEQFSFNAIKLKVRIDGSPRTGVFLYYADAYHPNWVAYVNGQRVPVIKTNIGYKSLMVPCGTNEVVLKFESRKSQIAMFCSLSLLFMVFCLTIYLGGLFFRQKSVV